MVTNNATIRSNEIENCFIRSASTQPPGRRIALVAPFMNRQSLSCDYMAWLKKQIRMYTIRSGDAFQVPIHPIVGAMQSQWRCCHGKVAESLDRPPPGPVRRFVAPRVLHAEAESTAATIVINEIHYAPQNKTAQLEYVELYNPTPNTVDLSNWTLSQGIDYIFPPGTQLAGGGYVAGGRTAGQRSTGLWRRLWGRLWGS